MNEQILLARRYLRMAWPYRWVALALSALICVAGWSYSIYVPNNFVVSAKIFVDTRSMLRPLLRGLAVENTSLSNTANLMKRTLATRPNLEEVARKTDLDLSAKTEEEFEKVVLKLTSNIVLTGTNQDNIYEISYTDTDKKRAKRVVDELLNTFLESALGSNRKDTAVTQKFLDEQIEEYEKRLIEAEQRLKEFKQRNAGQMMQEGSGYFQSLQAAKAKLKEATLELNEAQNRSNSLHAELASAEKGSAQRASSPLRANAMQRSPLDERISQTEQKLDALRLQYTDKHPDIIALTAQLEQLQQQRTQEIQTSTNGDAGNMDYRQSDDGNSLLGRVRLEVAKADASVSALKARVQFLDAEAKNLEKAVDTIPEVEAELKRLDRDYGLNRHQFDELIKRREAARLSEEVDEQGSDVKLKVIEPPRLPLTPVGPNRGLYITMTLAIALGAGAALSFLLSQLNPRFFSADELKEVTQLPVLGCVSLVYSRHQRAEKRMELAVFAMMLFGLICVYGGLMTLQALEFDLHGKVTALVRS